ncbi:hypothetical protein SAMN05444373_10023 [Thermoclostridium caenicola]|uniref:Uncharacterized protein n=2 Tax=Thermoclostridium caenicola TaxID=659425 RepID=A0A1M6AY17_9FIRM|nr:hypothetical protein SAMN05444373_10023 [Thermoclostridium caenicola]
MRSKSIRIILRMSIIILIFILAIGYALPVSFDAATCATGYKKWLIDTNQNQFNALLQEKYPDFHADFASAVDKISWDYHTVFIPVRIIRDDDKIDLVITGRRYWFDKYIWSIGKQE